MIWCFFLIEACGRIAKIEQGVESSVTFHAARNYETVLFNVISQGSSSSL